MQSPKDDQIQNVSEQFLIRKQTLIVKNTRDIKDVYKIETVTLGSGTYGTVNQVTHKVTGHVRACKTIPRNKIKNWERF